MTHRFSPVPRARGRVALRAALGTVAAASALSCHRAAAVDAAAADASAADAGAGTSAVGACARRVEPVAVLCADFDESTPLLYRNGIAEALPSIAEDSSASVRAFLTASDASPPNALSIQVRPSAPAAATTDRDFLLTAGPDAPPSVSVTASFSARFGDVFGITAQVATIGMRFASDTCSLALGIEATVASQGPTLVAQGARSSDRTTLGLLPAADAWVVVRMQLSTTGSAPTASISIDDGRPGHRVSAEIPMYCHPGALAGTPFAEVGVRVVGPPGEGRFELGLDDVLVAVE